MTLFEANRFPEALVCGSVYLVVVQLGIVLAIIRSVAFAPRTSKAAMLLLLATVLFSYRNASVLLALLVGTCVCSGALIARIGFPFEEPLDHRASFESVRQPLAGCVPQLMRTAVTTCLLAILACLMRRPLSMLTGSYDMLRVIDFAFLMLAGQCSFGIVASCSCLRSWRCLAALGEKAAADRLFGDDPRDAEPAFDRSLLAETFLEHGLSQREAEVAALICQGKSLADIALALGIARSTAGTYAARVYRKLDANGRDELMTLVDTFLEGQPDDTHPSASRAANGDDRPAPTHRQRIRPNARQLAFALAPVLFAYLTIRRLAMLGIAEGTVVPAALACQLGLALALSAASVLLGFCAAALDLVARARLARHLDEPRLRLPLIAEGLTEREAEFALLAARGATAPEIARQLFVSPSTAYTHLRHVYRKLGVHSREALTERMANIYLGHR